MLDERHQISSLHFRQQMLFQSWFVSYQNYPDILDYPCGENFLAEIDLRIGRNEVRDNLNLDRA